MPDESRELAALAAHLRIEIAPPLHPLMNRVNQLILAETARQVSHVDGTGVLVGVVVTAKQTRCRTLFGGVKT